jgi:hypothetical protein
MGGPIVRTGTTPAYWENWEKAFCGSKAAGKKAAVKKPAKSAKPKAAKKKSKKK